MFRMLLSNKEKWRRQSGTHPDSPPDVSGAVPSFHIQRVLFMELPSKPFSAVSIVLFRLQQRCDASFPTLVLTASHLPKRRLTGCLSPSHPRLNPPTCVVLQKHLVQTDMLAPDVEFARLLSVDRAFELRDLQEYRVSSIEKCDHPPSHSTELQNGLRMYLWSTQFPKMDHFSGCQLKYGTKAHIKWLKQCNVYVYKYIFLEISVTKLLGVSSG